jgi:hypothetical protein
VEKRKQEEIKMREQLIKIKKNNENYRSSNVKVREREREIILKNN